MVVPKLVDGSGMHAQEDSGPVRVGKTCAARLGRREELLPRHGNCEHLTRSSDRAAWSYVSYVVHGTLSLVVSSGPDDLAARLARVLPDTPGVDLAYLFGSQAAGRGRNESDIDVGVLVSADALKDRDGTVARLLDGLGRVVGSDRLDLVLLNDAPSLLRQRVLATGRLLYARTPSCRVRFVCDTIRDYQDMQVRREWFRGKRVGAIREGRIDGGSGDLLAQARRVARLFGQAPRLPSSR